jgi:hypothetical protein
LNSVYRLGMKIGFFAKLTAAMVLAMLPIVGFSQHSGASMGGGSMGGGGMPSGGGSSAMPNPGTGMGDGGMSRPFRSHGTDSMAGMRKAREHEMWRAHREQLDLDPHGHLVVRQEVVALTPSPQAIAAAQAKGFAVRRQEKYEGFEIGVVIFETPPGMSIRRALKRLRKLDPAGTYDFNHVYLESGGTDSTASGAVPTQTGLSRAPAGEGAARFRIGLIDGGVEAGHPALRSATVHLYGCSDSVVPSAHGTAVASRLLAGLGGQDGRSARAELFAADIYCGTPTGGSVDSLVGALAWLVQERVPVINLSVVGPPNLLLERAVGLVAARGHLIVAAVGNDGPAAPPLYPASYPEVIAVTGVDGSDKVLIEAGRRGHVDFAAPGADIFAASLPAGYAQVRGTSYAAPIVAGLLAQRLERPDRLLAEQAVGELVTTATDLGAHGVDPVYGNGCVGCDLQNKKF